MSPVRRERHANRPDIRSADVGAHLLRYGTVANGAACGATVAFRHRANYVPTDFGASGTAALPSAKRRHEDGIDSNVSQADRPLRRTHRPCPHLPSTDVDGRLALRGTLDIHGVTEAERILKRSWGKGIPRTLDLAGLDHLDTPGALLLCALRNKGVELTGVRAEHQSLLDLICGLDLEAAAEAARRVAGARVRHAARQGRGRGVARHPRRDRVRRTRRERRRLRARAPERVAVAVDFPPDRRNRRRRAADRRAPGGDDQHRHRVSGRRPAAALRRRGPHHRPRRSVGAARDGRADHRDSRRRALGLRVHRRDRRHARARGSRRARGHGTRSASSCSWCRGSSVS